MDSKTFGNSGKRNERGIVPTWSDCLCGLDTSLSTRIIREIYELEMENKVEKWTINLS